MGKKGEEDITVRMLRIMGFALGLQDEKNQTSGSLKEHWCSNVELQPRSACKCEWPVRSANENIGRANSATLRRNV